MLAVMQIGDSNKLFSLFDTVAAVGGICQFWSKALDYVGSLDLERLLQRK
jgi:hypothetical protein